MVQYWVLLTVMLEKIEVFGHLQQLKKDEGSIMVHGSCLNSNSVNIAGGFYAEGGELESPESMVFQQEHLLKAHKVSNYGIWWH